MTIPLSSLSPEHQALVRNQSRRQRPSRLRAKGRKRPATGMNKTEARYQQHLEQLQSRGDIAWFAFEGLKLRLADRTFYTPDFVVMRADGLIELHDVKGRKGDGFWAEEDAMVKIKTVAEVHPFAVCVVWERKGGGWDRKDF